MSDKEAKADWERRQAKLARQAMKNDSTLTFETALANQKKADLKQYGKISNVKQYTNAKRADYVQDLRDDSIWMSNGKKRTFTPAGAGATGSIIGGTVGGVIGGGIGTALVGESVRFRQENFDEATNEWLEKYQKNKGGGSKIENNLEKANEKIDEHVKEHLMRDTALGGEGLKEAEADAKIATMKDSEKDIVLKTHKENLQADLDEKEVLFEEAKKAFKADPSKKAQFRDASQARQRAQDQHDAVKNARERQQKAQEAFEKEKKEASKT
jgi:hypothetical protein